MNHTPRGTIIQKHHSLNTRDVFINVPFDSDYERLFLALIAGLTGLGFTPRCVLEISPKKNRLHRIYSLIKKCPYSIHDLSRVQLSTGHPRCPRFNMPFELGLAVAFSIADRKHSWAVLEAKDHRIQKSLSDLNGFDPYTHNGKPKELLRQLLNIFEFKSLPRPQMSELESIYKELIKAVTRLKKQNKIQSLYERGIFGDIVFLGRNIAEQLGVNTKMAK